MPSSSQQLAEALEMLHILQQQGKVAIYTTDLPKRGARQRLVKSGFLKEVTKGWYIPSSPDEVAGDSSSWYASYWEFCVSFLQHKYGDAWCLSADQSLQLHGGNRTVPSQLIVRSPNASNSITPLPFQSSMFNLKAGLPVESLLANEHGIRLYNLPASLVYCSAGFFEQNPIDSRTALALIRDASEVLPILLENGHTIIAGRLAGAFRNNDQKRIADQIVKAMNAAGYDTRETDPFNYKLDFQFPRERSPFTIRIRLMWQNMRAQVLAHFPEKPGLPKDAAAYLKNMEELYVTDAYHSLSIERYQVSPELIERVRSGLWNKDKNKGDRDLRNAMAARGYYLAFQEVKKSITKVLNQSNPGKVADTDHSDWYQQMFEPSVEAGLLKPMDLAGYRNHQVYIGGSKHVPLSVDAMRDAMPVLFDLLENEPEPAVRAVLGHFVFGFVHPYMDGNGRMTRFLMNLMLASGGYPWTVIPVQQREAYMKALEEASTQQHIIPFAQLIGNLVDQTLRGHPEASLDSL